MPDGLSSVAIEAAEAEAEARVLGDSTPVLGYEAETAFADGAEWCASRLPSEEELAEAIARTMPGWNDDISEPELEGSRRKAMEAHWERLNAECVRQGREYARAVLALIGEKIRG